MPKKSDKTPNQLLIEACEGGYSRPGTNFDRADFLIAADLVKAGLIDVRDDGEDGWRIFGTDKGFLRFHQIKAAEYEAKVRSEENRIKT